MTQAASSATSHNDADLVAASRKGDRKAFGRIVERYQAMIAGLVYAHCGSLHQSEDIAQDTFISAWKSISGLSDPLKLSGWLCQIARRRLADTLRKNRPNETPFSQGYDYAAETDRAAEQPPSAEDAEYLWRTLSKIPQPYRETMVLYYRQEQSTPQVAAAMETTEEAVRQRLVRGRQMLRDELTSSMERQLARSAPNRQFTLRVVAALPVIPTMAAQTGALSATAKGAGLAKAGGISGLILGWIAPLGVIFGLIFGTIQDARMSQSRRQRLATIWLGFGQFAFIAAWAASYYFLPRVANSQGWTLSQLVSGFSVATCVFGAALFALVACGRWRIESLLRAEGSIEPPFPTVSLGWRLVFAAPVVAIFLGWMIQLAFHAGDTTGIAIVAGLILVQSLWLAWRMPQLQPDRTIQQTFETFSLALVSIVALANWRFDIWAADIKTLPLHADSQSVSLWSLNACACVLFVWLTAITLWDHRTRSQSR